jgi:carbonic anhydrase
MACQPVIDPIRTAEEKPDKLCEINVIEQVLNAGQTTILQNAWLRKQNISIHGWIYCLTDGIVRDLEVMIDSLEESKQLRAKMLAGLKGN